MQKEFVVKTYAKRLGLSALLVAAALALASYAAATGGSMQGVDHGSKETGFEEGADRGSTDHGSANDGAEGASWTVTPAEAGVELQARVEPASPAPGEPTELAYRVSDAQSGEAISELPVDHERQMHLIAVSRDLEQFQHVHPEPGASGDFAVTTEFPTEGTYALFDEFVRDGRKVLDRREIEVGAGGGAASLSPDLEPKTVDGLTVSLEAPEEIRAGEEIAFTYTLEKEDGTPAEDLEPYLGAPAHVAIVSEDTQEFAHTHGEADLSEEDGSGMHSETEAAEEGEHAGHGKGRTFGPEIGLHYTFETPGLYKVWAQFNHHGSVITVPFVVEVA
jgi:Cu+-exporting ATPase